MKELCEEKWNRIIATNRMHRGSASFVTGNEGEEVLQGQEDAEQAEESLRKWVAHLFL
jgi:hypothetical protein